MVIVKKKRVKDTGFYDTTYRCDWPDPYGQGLCGKEFNLLVKKGGGGTADVLGGRHDRVSTQVVCPRCGNGLKTWEEGDESG